MHQHITEAIHSFPSQQREGNAWQVADPITIHEALHMIWLAARDGSGRKSEKVDL